MKGEGLIGADQPLVRLRFKLTAAQNEIERLTALLDAEMESNHRLVARELELTAEVSELRAALQPFADFNDAMKEWRFGPRKYLLQAKRPEDKPFLRWVEPSAPPGVPGKLKMEFRVLEVWPQDFARAEKLCVSGNQK